MDIKDLVDFHCHIDLYEDYVQLINTSELNRIRTLAVTTTPKAWMRNRELTKNTKYVRAALGLHPQLVGEDASKELNLWESFLSEAKYIGEVGLDAGPNFVHTFDEQKRVFEYILKCCANVEGRILSVHSVRAVSTTLDFIERLLPANKGTVVLHWFTGNSSEAQRAINMGCYFSLNTAMLQTKKGLELLKRLPLEKLLTETDGPFIELDGRPSKPVDVINTVHIIAKQVGKTSDDLLQIINSNLRDLTSKYI